VDIGSPANPLERASLLERSLLVGYGLEAWRAQPLTGVGAGGFVQWAARHAPEGRSFEPVHNTLLLMLAETGVVGGIAVIAAAGVFLWRVWSRREVMSAAEAAWAAVLSGVCVTGLFDHLWWTQPPARTLFVMAVALWTVEQGRYNVGDPLPKGEAVYETL
jgi:O-antigen ligase